MEISAQNPIVYLSAEFGLENKLPVYAGGLGILAGDILKGAADQHLHMLGIGLLYRGEEAIQNISPEGNQVEANFNFDPQEAGLELVMDVDSPLYIKIHLTQVDVWVRVWRYRVGETVDLYLLDPDNEKNHSHERRLAYAIYSGTQEEIIKQQLVLGIGGVKLVRALGKKAYLFHINEGRPSFLHWQLVRHSMDYDGLSYADSVKTAINCTVYTNHTVVPAGNKSYDIDLLRAYAKYYSGKMGIDVNELLRPGIEKNGDGGFSITRYALNVSKKASSVSLPHFAVCKHNWPEYNWVNVTNGVHFPTWQADNLHEADYQNRDLWARHLENKRAAADYIAQRTGFSYDPHKLVITWARRVTEYKQLDLLFRDIDRLQSILLSTEKPVQLLVAGKAHVFDQNGKKIIREAIGYMSHELAGHALFIPNYNIDMGKALTRGSDLWLNFPRHGEEASGTSGMKAISNGLLQLTMPDGWCGEVDWFNVGWTINPDPSQTSNSIYDRLSNDIIPLFYRRNEEDLPLEWIEMMRRSREIAPHYSARRMVDQYRELLYN